MSSISSDNIVNVILFYVTPEIHIPFIFGDMLFKSAITGETIELQHEIKSNAIKMLDNRTKEYGNIKNISLQSKVIIEFLVMK